MLLRATITTSRKGFRVNAKIHQFLKNRKNRIERRLDKKRLGNASRPAFTATNIHYDVADRVHGISHGGIGALHLLAQRIGLIEAIDQDLHLLLFHKPYHESDHVLTRALVLLNDKDVAITRDYHERVLVSQSEEYAKPIARKLHAIKRLALAKGKEAFSCSSVERKRLEEEISRKFLSGLMS